jgi:hypothetical protein
MIPLMARLTGASLLTFACATAAATEPRGVYYLASPGSLAVAKQRIAAGDEVLQRALEHLIGSADELLATPPPSVTAKEQPAPSGDPHDYASNAPYYWPNPDTLDGLPYVRRDGRRNPESADERWNDRNRVSLLGYACETLGLAWYFTGRQVYADRAAHFARTWFVDPATRMRPELRYAQAVRGVVDGRAAGVLEGRHIGTAIDALGLIADADSLSASDRQAIDDWLDAYLEWLQTAGIAQAEGRAANNHGTYYDVQLVQLALAAGRREFAVSVLEAAKQRRIEAQFAPDGSQPHELSRTRSLSYTEFNLQAFCDLATLADHVGVDLWHYESADGRSIRRGLEFLAPFVAVPPRRWPHEQITPFNASAAVPLFHRARLAYDDPGFARIVAMHPDAGDRFRLLHVIPPTLSHAP